MSAVEWLEQDLDHSTASLATRVSEANGLTFTRVVGYRDASNVTRSMFSILSAGAPGSSATVVGCPVCGDVQYPGRRCPVHDMN